MKVATRPLTLIVSMVVARKLTLRAPATTDRRCLPVPQVVLLLQQQRMSAATQGLVLLGMWLAATSSRSRWMAGTQNDSWTLPQFGIVQGEVAFKTSMQL